MFIQQDAQVLKLAVTRAGKLMEKIEELVSSETSGTLSEEPKPLPPVVVETMKMVFRETHGAEMTHEDREFLGIADQ